MKLELYHGDCFDILPTLPRAQCLIADPPDNIGLGYDECKDKKSYDEYVTFLEDMVYWCIASADITWFSFNAKWTFEMGRIFQEIIHDSQFQACRGGPLELEGKACVQTFTFNQNRDTDLGNGTRPLWRLMRKGSQLYPDQIRVPSWRQLHGDKRASPHGKVPNDHFDFPRVTGNSKQRRPHHPTQLHEGLVERCIKLSTKESDYVIDPFGGTGTTMRVSRAINRDCTLIEMSEFYCSKIAEEHGIKVNTFPDTSAA